MTVCFTVDVEQDCPPYLDTWRGIEEGMPKLLDALNEDGVIATCFTTGDVARRYPGMVQQMVDRGHELGCHGDTHASFAEMSTEAADAELGAASATLRAFAPVQSFRAPYLRLPRAHVRLLASHGYTIDSSEGRHKRLGASVHADSGVLRVPASVTSSTLRWPAALRNLLFARLADPIVLFVHPWEFVDLRRERLRYDCRFRTGDAALDAVRTTVQFFRRRGARFAPMSRCAGQ